MIVYKRMLKIFTCGYTCMQLWLMQLHMCACTHTDTQHTLMHTCMHTYTQFHIQPYIVQFDVCVCAFEWVRYVFRNSLFFLLYIYMYTIDVSVCIFYYLLFDSVPFNRSVSFFFQINLTFCSLLYFSLWLKKILFMLSLYTSNQTTIHAVCCHIILGDYRTLKLIIKL